MRRSSATAVPRGRRFALPALALVGLVAADDPAVRVRDAVAALNDDRGITRANWRPAPDMVFNTAVNIDIPPLPAPSGTSDLVAWDPVAQKAVWEHRTPGVQSAGVLATVSNLVFQGRQDGVFNAYAADNGKLLWSFPTQAPVMAPAISRSRVANM